MDLIIDKFKEKLYFEKRNFLEGSDISMFSKGKFNKKKLKEIAKFKRHFNYKGLVADKNILFYKNDKIIFNKQNTIKSLLTFYGDELKNELDKFGNISKKYSKKQLIFFDFLKKNNIKQIRIDSSLRKFNRIQQMYNLTEYFDPDEPCLFFGYYSKEQLEIIYNHEAEKYVMFGGSDISEDTDLDYDFEDVTFIAISKNLQKRLNDFDIESTLIELDLVDYKKFKKLDKKGPNIFVYDKPYDSNKAGDKINNKRYNIPLINKIMNKLPQYNFILNSTLNLEYENMPKVYEKCFIALRLTTLDGNANSVQECKAMNIPVVHNLSEYGLKWNSMNDIINYINFYHNLLVRNNYTIFNKNKINFDNNINFTKYLNDINLNIDYFSLFLKQFKNILFISSGYSEYDGPGSMAYNLVNFYKKDHDINCIYWKKEGDTNSNKDLINESEIQSKLRHMKFQQDIIILTNPIKINIKDILKCPIIFLIPGIFNDCLDKNYYKLYSIKDFDKNINKKVINQIKKSDYSFCNSSHTQSILKSRYNLETHLFYSAFVNYYRITSVNNKKLEDRRYDYGLIVNDFNKPIKNIKKSINFLKNQTDKKVILIGKNSEQYDKLGFDTFSSVDIKKIHDYYQDIKYIIQDSHYESCSNVAVEAFFNGCKRREIVIVSSTQYPGYSGTATNAYRLIKHMRKSGINVCGIFFHDDLSVNYNPDNLKGIYLFDSPESNVYKTCFNYLNEKPNVCMTSNYLDSIYCKKIFDCHTIYMVSKINHFELFYPNISAQVMLDSRFKIDKKIEKEEACNNLVDEIVFNSDLTKKLFEKIYPKHKHKITNVKDNSYLYSDINLGPITNKEYDIVICANDWNKNVKNAKFLLNLFDNKKMDKYNKIVIGDNYKKFTTFANMTVTGLLDYNKCLETLDKCKIILCPSLYESDPPVLLEAKKLNCMPILTKNIGNSKKYSEDCICYSYDINEWITKIEFLMNKIKYFHE